MSDQKGALLLKFFHFFALSIGTNIYFSHLEFFFFFIFFLLSLCQDLVLTDNSRPLGLNTFPEDFPTLAFHASITNSFGKGHFDQLVAPVLRPAL